MKEPIFQPFANESDCLQIKELTVENRLDRVSIYGSIDLTKDKAGLVAAREFKSIIDQVVSELEQADLPDKVSLAAPKTVKNPFA